MPNLTIITVTFNDSSSLLKTLHSISIQENKPDQWIIIDGGSKYFNEDFESQLIIPDVRVDIVSEPDRGIYDAMNKGLNLVRNTNYVLFLNAGDLLSHEALPSLINSPGFLNYETVSYFGHKIRNRINDFRYGLPVVHQSIIFPYSGLRYDATFKLSADYDFYLKHDLKHFRSAFFDTKGYVTYQRGGLSDQKFILLSLERWKIIFRNFGIFPLLKAIGIDLFKIAVKIILPNKSH
jgi:glycosyltransferase involved in cell wall biosynthesis